MPCCAAEAAHAEPSGGLPAARRVELAEKVEDLAACVDDLAGSFLPQAFSRLERVLSHAGGKATGGGRRNSALLAAAGRGRATQPELAEQTMALAAARRQGTNVAVAGIL